MKALTRSFLSFWGSSIGRKIVVALSGLLLLLYLPAHLAGNLLVFVGPEALNEYAAFLHDFLHGAGIWLFRFVMLAAFVTHIALSIQLTRENRSARAAYVRQAAVRTSLWSRTMIWSGLTILAFVVYHVLHFTVRAGTGFNEEAYKTTLDGERVHNVHKMMIDGFSSAPASIAYIVGLTLLCSHLSHGFASMFQTLGIRSDKTSAVIGKLGWLYALVIWLGFLSIPVSIWIFGYGR